MAKREELSIFWFRRDLRLHDNHGLYRALRGEHPVLCLFIFDIEILEKLPARDARVQFIWQELQKLKGQLEEQGSSLLVKHGKPLAVWRELVEEFALRAVYTNRDYEPYAQERDKAVYQFLQERDISFTGYKDQVLLEKNEVLKDNDEAYVVYTPYMKRHKQILTEGDLQCFPSEEKLAQCFPCQPFALPTLEEMGFEAFDFQYPGRSIDRDIIARYHRQRDIPSLKGTTRLSLHLRFGTISVRALARVARETNEKFYNEIIWRDFYQAVLYHFPHSLNESFRRAYEAIEWENNQEHFEAWCRGKTGYPLVDAGMRELNQTGFMHNRVRMLVASFLTKHLLIDWRWGESYFAEKLLDYEAASNVGGWQWAAGSGVDAAPYFRIFNPSTQLDKFDKERRYVKNWLPEYGSDQYPAPIVEHKKARERALERYKSALKGK